MALDAKEFDQVPRQQFRIGGAMRRVTRLTALRFDRRMLKHEWPLFIGVTFNAGRIAVDGVAQRSRQKPTVLVVTVGAFHAAFRNFMVKRFGEGRFLVGMALIAQFGLRRLKQELGALRRVRGMAIGAGDAVAEMLAAPEVEPLLAAALRTLVALQAGRRSLG